MGFRTVVVLYNDQCSEWEKDPNLGRKISTGMNYAMNPDNGGNFSGADLNYGMVVECAHADTQRLLALDGYRAHWLPGASHWRRNDTTEAMKLRLLKEAADELGYKLVKKPTPAKPAWHAQTNLPASMDPEQYRDG